MYRRYSRPSSERAVKMPVRRFIRRPSTELRAVGALLRLLRWLLQGLYDGGCRSSLSFLDRDEPACFCVAADLEPTRGRVACHTSSPFWGAVAHFLLCGPAI